MSMETLTALMAFAGIILCAAVGLVSEIDDAIQRRAHRKAMDRAYAARAARRADRFN